VVRENTEGEYSAIGGRMFGGTEREVVVQETVMSRVGVDRVLAEVLPEQKVDEVRQRREDGFRVVELVCRYEKGPVALKVVFDATDRIGAVFFNPIAPDAVDPVLEERARELVTNFTGGHFEQAMKHFDPVMRHNLPAEGLLALSKQVGERYGTFTSAGAIRQRKAQGLRIVEVTAIYSLQHANISVVFNAGNQIAGLRIRISASVEDDAAIR